MKTSNKMLLAALIVSALTVVFLSCQKDNSGLGGTTAKQNVQIYLNDDPIPNLYKVLVDIRYVEVKVDTGTSHHDDDFYDDDHDGDNDHHDHDRFGQWDTLSITPRVYDLLQLKNGVDSLLASNLVSNGKITKIRITLGTNNEVWTDSTHSFPLPLCDGRQYIYVRVRSNTIETLSSGQIRIRVDFDVAKSVQFVNGAYCFGPRLQCYNDNTTGRIEGVVKPRDAHALIKVFNSTDTAFAIPEKEGEFKIRGLKPATYSVLYKAVSPFKDTTITDVQVVAGRTTALHPVTLHQ